MDYMPPEFRLGGNDKSDNYGGGGKLKTTMPLGLISGTISSLYFIYIIRK